MTNKYNIGDILVIQNKQNFLGKGTVVHLILKISKPVFGMGLIKSYTVWNLNKRKLDQPDFTQSVTHHDHDTSIDFWDHSEDFGITPEIASDAIDLQNRLYAGTGPDGITPDDAIKYVKQRTDAPPTLMNRYWGGYRKNINKKSRKCRKSKRRNVRRSRKKHTKRRRR